MHLSVFRINLLYSSSGRNSKPLGKIQVRTEERWRGNVVKIRNCISSSSPPMPIPHGVSHPRRATVLIFTAPLTSLLTQLFILLQKYVPLICSLLLHELKLKNTKKCCTRNYVSGAARLILRWITVSTWSTTDVMVLTKTAPHSISCLMPITVRNPPRYKKLWYLGWLLRSYTRTKSFKFGEPYQK
jgi:hypothetical protein